MSGGRWLLFRLASGSGRTAIARQALVVAGTAFGSMLLLVAAGIATLDDSDFGTPSAFVCDAAEVCTVVETLGSGPISLDYLVQPGLRTGVVLGFVLCVVPLLVFVGVASRVAARRRDERLAALRLAGASRGQVRALAVLDASVGAAAGAALGAALYLVTRSVVFAVDEAQASAIVERTTPTLWLGATVLVALVAALAAASTLTLRAVQVGPLDVRRRAPRRAPRPWGLLLFLPVLLFPVLNWIDPYLPERESWPLVAIVIATMGGLVACAPWLTSLAGRSVAARSARPAIVLAGRRLQHDPRPQARAMVSVVLVVFAATIGLMALAETFALGDDQAATDDGFVLRGYGAAGLGMLVSLVVGAAGLLLTTTESALERRHTLAALHAGGVPLSTLRRSLLAQVAVPVLPGAVLAMTAGLVFSWALFGWAFTSWIAALTLVLPPLATLAAVAATSLTLPVLRTVVDVERLRTP